MRALYSAFFSRFGLPRQLHSDQGSNFQSKLVAELCSIAGINKTRTTPFYPRSDGRPRGRIGQYFKCFAPRSMRMARSPARTVGGIPYDAALSDGHQPQCGHAGAGSPATGFSHSAAAGGARRSHYLFHGRVSSKHAQRACVRSQRDQPRCENTEKITSTSTSRDLP